MRYAAAVPLCFAFALITADDPKKSAKRPALEPQPPSELTLAPQPIHGLPRPVLPAHRLALLATNQPLPSTDVEVSKFAELLAQLTAAFVEDAPRIAELTSRTCREIRATNQSSAPAEILEAALLWKRPKGTRPDVPKRFSDYIRRYSQFRLKDGKDHAAVIAILKSEAAPTRKP